jgi:hypothetical protein
MVQETSIPTRMALAVAAAACSLTVAAGITGAALLGYVGPGRYSAPPDTAAAADAANAALNPQTSGVVLVPVQPALPAPTLDGDTDEPRGLLLASRRDEKHGEHFRGDEGMHHEDDHDDD